MGVDAALEEKCVMMSPITSESGQSQEADGKAVQNLGFVPGRIELEDTSLRPHDGVEEMP